MRAFILFTVLCLGIAVGKADSVPKKSIALFTPEQIQRARQRLANEEPARQAVQDILQMAQQWAQFSDDYLRETIPPPQVPRAFNISFSGCPVCGRETFKYGNYGFETPLEKPWKVICPNCKSEFPSNDFGAFLKSGMKDRSLLTGDYPDDGWGGKSPARRRSTLKFEQNSPLLNWSLNKLLSTFILKNLLPTWQAFRAITPLQSHKTPNVAT